MKNENKIENEQVKTEGEIFIEMETKKHDEYCRNLNEKIEESKGRIKCLTLSILAMIVLAFVSFGIVILFYLKIVPSNYENQVVCDSVEEGNYSTK